VRLGSLKFRLGHIFLLRLRSIPRFYNPYRLLNSSAQLRNPQKNY